MKLISILMLVCSIFWGNATLFAEDFYCLDGNNKVKDYKKSIDPSVAPGECTTVTDPNTTRSLINNVPFKYLKVVDGQLAEMTIQEKSNVDSAEQAALDVIKEQEIDNLNVSRNEVLDAILELIQEKANISITKQEIAATIRENRAE